MKHLLTIILLSVGLQVSAQVTPLLPAGATSYSSQIYRKISGSDTTYYTGATGKGFLKLGGYADVLRLQDSISNKANKSLNNVSKANVTAKVDSATYQTYSGLFGRGDTRWLKISNLSGTGIVKSTSGTISYLTDNSSNWNTAYTYSQVGHLPLAGGTLTGALTGTSLSLSSNNTPLILNSTTGNYSLIDHRYGGAAKGVSGYNAGSMYYGGESGTGTIIQAGGVGGLTMDVSTREVTLTSNLTAPSITLSSGASNGKVLTSDASGNATWQTVASAYKGTWDASTNTPTIADGTGTAGDYYVVSTGGTSLGRTFVTAGQAIYNGSIWQNVGSAAGVTSVNGYTGTVALTKSDLSLGNVDNTSDATKNSATATLTNKTISGSANTITNIAQSSVTNLTSDLATLMPKAGGTFTGGVTGTSWTSANSIPFVLSSPTTIDFHQSGAGTVRFVNDAFTNVNLALTNAGDMTVRGGLAVTGGTVTASTFTGNAATATALATPRTIAGVSFDGSANISLNNNAITNGAGYITGNQSITLSGAVTGSGTTAITTTLASGIDATKLADGTVTSTELQYINSLTSNAQTQLNAKAPLASPALTGTPTAPTASAGNNSTQVATTAYVDGMVSSGTYTPTLTNGMNVTSSTAPYNFHYIKIGNEVIVTGNVSITPTAGGSQCLVDFSLPIASNFASAGNAVGHGSSTSADMAGLVTANTSNDRVTLSTSVFLNTTIQNLTFSFTYTIL